MGGRRLLQPQEVEVFYVLPAIRMELAKAMAKQDIGQKEIAKRLGITEAAVSQYKHGKRAKVFPLGKGLCSSIEKSAHKITDTQSAVREMQLLLKSAMTDKTTCRVHELLGVVPANCTLCFEAKK
ncbi:MAG: hypothetical protein Q7K43_05885 [Candidatus Woesearchaeota archaeon]|nr:hypothetical protein [Candidatus Woesearchaeota archaeon]